MAPVFYLRVSSCVFWGLGVLFFTCLSCGVTKTLLTHFFKKKDTSFLAWSGYYPSSLSIIIFIDVYFEILAEGRQICIVGEEYVEVTQGRPFGFEVECVTIDGEPTQGLCSNLTFYLFNSLLLPRN